jgi:hypothetical protein
MWLQNCAEEKSKWVNMVYFLVMNFGERTYDGNNGLTGCTLSIANASAIPVPIPDNPLDWAYDKETDTVSFTIKEELKSMIVVPGESVL